MRSRSNHRANVRLANKRVMASLESLEIRSQLNEKIGQRTNTAEHLTDRHQLMNAREIFAYVTTTIGTSL